MIVGFGLEIILGLGYVCGGGVSLRAKGRGGGLYTLFLCCCTFLSTKEVAGWEGVELSGKHFLKRESRSRT